MKLEFGSIDQLPSVKNTSRKKVGSWRARYSAPNGKRISKTFPNKTAAQAWLAGEKRLIDLEVWEPPQIRLQKQEAEQQRAALTVGQWVNQWLDSRKPHLQLSTWQSYERVINNRITDVKNAPSVSKLSALPLADLTKTAVHDWWDAMNTAFDTPSTNYKAHKYLRAAITNAVERDLIPANPVAVKAARKKPVPKDKELPDIATLKALVNNLPARYQLIGALCLFMGVRMGEALALTRDRLVNIGTADSPQWVVEIRHNLQRVRDDDGHTVMVKQPPKTKAGYRDVKIFPFLNEIVAAHLEDFAPEKADEYLTTTRVGKPVFDTSFRSVLQRAGERAGVKKKVTPHYGRNWLITYLAEAGATPVAIGRALGQTDLKTITEIYMKVRSESVDAALGLVADQVNRVGGKVVPFEKKKAAEKKEAARATEKEEG